MWRLRCFLVIALLIACTGAASAQSQVVTIENVGTRQWRTTYRLSSPATSLRFDRPAAFFRERVWRVVTPGYRLQRRGDRQWIVLDSNATPRREIVVEFPEFTGELPKEYELFQPFSDGAVAVYTGHFHADAFTTSGDSARIRTFRIRPRSGERTIANGRISQGVLDFVDSSTNGTYVYIGTATPIETPHLVAVVDPGMPEWLKTLFDRNLPRIFAEYAARLGVVLPVKPVVYFSFSETGSGRSSGGGTLDGLISMVLSGNDWRQQSPGAVEQAFALIAHESAHMWNGQLVANADDGAGSWMHEGSADAMANELLLKFGVIDSARYRGRREEALNNCVSAVQAGSVESALRRGNQQMVYDCGFVLAMWTAAVAGKRTAGADLFTFWQRLIAGARDKGSYDTPLYFATLQAVGHDAAAIAQMRTFLASKDSAFIALDGMRSAGISLRQAPGTPPVSYGQNHARKTMFHVMLQACNRVSFNWGDPVRTAAIPTCVPFARELTVHRIQGRRVGDEGAAMYDAVRATCATGGAVTLEGQDGTMLVSVPCTAPLPPRVPWLEISG